MKFVAVVMAVACTVVFSAASLADGWKLGNWEPPTKAPLVKAVSFNADWGTVEPAASVASAGCRGVARIGTVEQAIVYTLNARQRAGCSGRGRLLDWGWRIRANREARARARLSAHAEYFGLLSAEEVTGHS